MKTKILRPILVAALAIAGTLSAHVVSSRSNAAPLPHAELVFDIATTSYTLVDEKSGDTVTVTWRAEPDCPNEKLIQKYTVVVTRTQNVGVVYSLWSLGLQDAEKGAEIEVSSTNGSLQIADSVWHPLSSLPLNTTKVISPAGLKALDPYDPSSPNVVNGDQIGLMEFTGTSFTFKVTRYGRPGITTWSKNRAPNCTPANGHDNTPPI